MENKQKKFRDKQNIEYVTCIRYFDNGKSQKCHIKKSLTQNKQYMAENDLKVFVEPNNEEIKEKLEKDRIVLSSNQ